MSEMKEKEKKKESIQCNKGNIYPRRRVILVLPSKWQVGLGKERRTIFDPW